MRMRPLFFIALSTLLLSACTPPPPVEQSRAALWQRFGNHSIDEVVLAWNAPSRETKLTNGARFLTYNRSATFNAASPYEQTVGCEASFVAPPPDYLVTNVALKGEPGECYNLAQRGPGYVRNVYIPPPPPPGFYPGPWR